MSVKRIRDFVPSPGSRADWYSIKNQANGDAEVTIYDDIGYFGVSAQNFIKDLGKVKGSLTLRINSGGGEVFDGLAIYNALNQRSDVSVYIDGIAASIASVISQAASPGKLHIAKRGQMMIHDGYTAIEGNAADFRKVADQLDQQSDNIAGVYADRTGKPVSYWREQMQAETWFMGEQAVQAGLADKVYEPVQNSLTNAANAGWMKRGGKWVFDPDNDGDDDSRPDGDPDHDYWAADGTQLKAIPPNPVTGKGGKPLPPKKKSSAKTKTAYWNAKYSQDDLRQLAADGKAMKNDDGSISYPIADAEDLSKAIRAVGRGNADHNAIRKHIIKRAKALKLSSQIPDNWNSDGSLSSQTAFQPLASLFSEALKGGDK